MPLAARSAHHYHFSSKTLQWDEIVCASGSGVPWSVPQREEFTVAELLKGFWADESGQDVAEYAVMLAVILVIVVGTIRLIGSNANNVFSQVGSSLNQ